MKELLKEIKKHKENIKNFILSIGCFSGVILYHGLDNTLNFSFFFLIFYLFILVFFLRITFKGDKKTKKYSLILSILFSIILVIGSYVNKFTYINNQMIFTLKNILFSLFQIIFFIPFFSRLFLLFFKYFGKLDLLVKKERRDTKKVFFFSWIFIFICHLPYFWRFYPGKLTVDTFLQLDFIKEGVLSDLHPFIQTQFVGLFYKLGMFLFSNETLAISLYIIVQMLILTNLFSYVISYLYRKKVNILVCFSILLSYSFLPLYTHYSVTLWKDVLFGGAFILVFISLIEFKFENKIKLSQLFLFILGILMILFFRNNGIYILFIMTPFIILSYKNNRKIFTPLLIFLMVFYFVIKGPVFNMIGVEKTNGVEAFSVPLQQIARVIAIDYPVDEDSLSYLNSIMDTSKIKESYTPYISDPIKNLTNRSKVDETKAELIKVWLKLLVKYPGVYIESYLAQTTGYWYTDVDYWTTSSAPNETSMPEFLCKIIDLTASKRLPFANLFWSIGLGFWFLVFSLFLGLYRKNKLAISYIPFLGLWITMMLASPVYAEFRYVFGLFTCMPLIILVPFLKNKEE